MKLLKSDENADAIKQLFLDAQKSIVIISPYIDIKNLEEMKKILVEKSERGIFIEVHSRKNRKEKTHTTVEEVEEEFKDINLNKRIYLHMDLHAKLFFNEKNAIITTFNLQSTSLGNIEIGYLLEDRDRKEFDKLLNDFYYKLFNEDNEQIIKHKEMFMSKKNVWRWFRKRNNT